MEILVPVGVFVLGIIISVTASGLGVRRVIEAKNSIDENLGRTAAYAAPFKDSQHGLADAITQNKR